MTWPPRRVVHVSSSGAVNGLATALRAAPSLSNTASSEGQTTSASI